MGNIKKRYCETWFKTFNIISTMSQKSVSNETNGIEPKSNILLRKVKKVPLKQIVPGIYFKNAYTLLWDMGSHEGYIKIVAMMQKYFDQAISGNWSYNPCSMKTTKCLIRYGARYVVHTSMVGKHPTIKTLMILR